MSPCATPQQLEEFVSERLVGGELEIVAGHIEECSLCQQVLERITAAFETKGRSQSGPTEVPDAARFVAILKTRGSRGAGLEPTTDAYRPHLGAVEPGPDPDSTMILSSRHISSALPAIGGFRIIREIGRGGMGVVYEAEETRLCRRVALKVLPASLFPEPKQVQRFEREARAAARLHHTNIVPVFGGGHHEGNHYYIMQYIEGRGIDAVLRELRELRRRSATVPPETLSHLTDGNRPAYRNLVQIGLQVALALDHAHGEGILHRDIKPSNLLLDAKANAWVTDFGLAKTLEADDLTSTGDVVGTLRYMAPERFAGRCDARSDLYGLGLTLYELVALRPAYEAADRLELIERIRREPPPSLRKLDPNIPRDLETIIDKLTAREPAHRYSSAAAVADDLRRFLEDRPIKARPASTIERALRWSRRNPWVAAFLVALSLGAIASSWQAFRATAAERAARRAEADSRDERNRAQIERSRAERERSRAERERSRAEQSRDRALGAVRRLLETGADESHVQELRPYRESLIKASLTESHALVREFEKDPRAEFQRIDAYTALARAQYDSGQTATALDSARTAVGLAEELVARDPTIAKNRGCLAMALHKLSSIEVADGSLAAARRSNELCRQLCADSPKDERALWLGLTAENHYNIGHFHCGEFRFGHAIESFQAAGTACEQIFALGAGTPRIRRFAAMTQLYLCRAYAYEKQPDRATASGLRAVAMAQALAVDDPDNFESGKQLNLAYEELAFRYINVDKPAEAIKRFESSRETLKQLAARHRRVVWRMAQIQELLARTDYNLCEVYDSDAIKYAESRSAAATEAFEIADKLSLLEPLAGNVRVIYASQCIEVAEYQEDAGEAPDLKALKTGEQLWDTISREAPTDRQARAYLVLFRRKIVDLLAARGNDVEASEWRLRSLTPARGDATLFYEIATEYAKRTGRVGLLPTRLTLPQVEARRQRLANHALAMLHEASHEGFHDGAKLRNEPAFASLAANPEFQAIVADLEFPVKVFARP